MGSIVLTPPLLPWLPGRAFALKGAWLGIAFLVLFIGFGWSHLRAAGGWLGAAAWCFLIPAAASFMAMNFTGATTYTSLSGVRKEMRAAVPVQTAIASLGVLLWVVGRFV